MRTHLPVLALALATAAVLGACRKSDVGRPLGARCSVTEDCKGDAVCARIAEGSDERVCASPEDTTQTDDPVLISGYHSGGAGGHEPRAASGGLAGEVAIPSGGTGPVAGSTASGGGGTGGHTNGGGSPTTTGGADHPGGSAGVGGGAGGAAPGHEGGAAAGGIATGGAATGGAATGGAGGVAGSPSSSSCATGAVRPGDTPCTVERNGHRGVLQQRCVAGDYQDAPTCIDSVPAITSAGPIVVGMDDDVVLTVRVRDGEGASTIEMVSIDAAAIGGGAAEEMVSTGAADESTEQFEYRLGTRGGSGSSAFVVTAIDSAGNTDHGVVMVYRHVGATIVVGSAGDAGTIEEALAAANDGDAVLLDPGIYAGAGNKNIAVPDINVAIIGTSGPDETIIDCEESGRAFLLHTLGLTSAVTIAGVTIENCTANAIRVVDSALELYQSALRNNTNADDGGALYVGDVLVDLTVGGVEFSNNVLDDSYEGAGAYLVGSGTARFDTVTFEGGQALYGGALAVRMLGDLAVVRGQVHGNAAQAGYGRGGGAYIQSSGRDTLDAVIEETAFVGNSSAEGGAVFIDQGNGAFVVRTSTFSTNQATYGGAMAIPYGWIDCAVGVEDSTFTGNTSTRGGGAIGSTILNSSPTDSRCALRVARSRFSDNSGGAQGGAINRIPAIVEDSSFERNSSTGPGGAIHTTGRYNTGWAWDVLSVVGSSFSGNSASSGGAISMGGGSIAHSLFSENVSSGGGGGLWLATSLDPVIIENILLADNEAGTGPGGGAFVGSSGARLSNLTFANNRAQSGGAMALSSARGTVELVNVIAHDNVATAEASGALQLVDIDPATVVDIGHSLMDVAQINDPGFTINDGTGFLTDGSGNLSSDPLFVDADNGNYRLQPDSPAVDAGSDTSVALDMSFLTTQQRQTLDTGIVDLGYHWEVSF